MVGRSLVPTHSLAKATTWNREIAMRGSKHSGFEMDGKAATESAERTNLGQRFTRFIRTEMIGPEWFSIDPLAPTRARCRSL